MCINMNHEFQPCTYYTLDLPYKPRSMAYSRRDFFFLDNRLQCDKKKIILRTYSDMKRSQETPELPAKKRPKQTLLYRFMSNGDTERTLPPPDFVEPGLLDQYKQFSASKV